MRLRVTEDLSGKFKGDIIGPDHADYERARLIWNAMIDRRPGLILRCTSTQDGVADGAIGDVAEPDTAFSNRGYLFWLNFAMRWDDPADDQDCIGRSRMIVAALAPWVGQGVYVNMLNFDEQDRVVEALGGPEKHARLARLKAQYDPQNLFRMNYNIPPAR